MFKNKSAYKDVFLCDFDKTVALSNVFEAVMAEFGSSDWQNISKDWFDGKIDTQESLERQVEHFQISDRALRKFLSQIELDSCFSKFVDYAGDTGQGIYIYSEGLDYFITSILRNCNLGHVSAFAHKLNYENDRWYARYAGSDWCGGKCGSFKAELVETFKRPETRITVVGDDASDLIAATKADVVFAKGKLIALCRTNNICCHEFKNFADVLNLLVKKNRRID